MIPERLQPLLDSVRPLAERFDAAGFKLYLVGGIVRDLLTGSGYEVAEAADGQAGVATAKSERPDLILMDIQLSIHRRL